MKVITIYLLGVLIILTSCNKKSEKETLYNTADSVQIADDRPQKSKLTLSDIKIEKDLEYDQYTLEDSYPYKDTTRMFQWDKIKQRLFFLDSIQQEPSTWAVLQNYKNLNGESSLIRDHVRNSYNRVADAYGTERYQSVALFLPADTITAERYGRDGSLVKYTGEEGNFYRISTTNFEGDWMVPKKYLQLIGDTVIFNKVVVVDRNNQNITTLEKINSTWYIKSMNPATTGLRNPPYGQATPLGLFVIQEKKAKMIYLKDGSQELGGFAPYASRFTNGAYLHGVPVNAPRTQMIEYSQTLGTTPRSHMCVRNATSHAKFIYEWAPIMQTIVFVIE